MSSKSRISVLGFSIVLLAAGLTLANQPTKSVGGFEGKGGGIVKGIVKFEGNQVARRPIRMDADPYCAKSHGADNPPLAERWVFGENDTLQNVFVYVTKGLEGKTFEVPAKVVIDQDGCVYHPHVSGVMVGQTVEILNSDNTLHNVKSLSQKNPAFNEGMPVKGMKLDKTFAAPELGIELKCDVHAWMSAYVHIVDSPFFAVSGKDGTFEIHGLPAGTYELSVRHEFSRFAPKQETITVTIEDGKTAEVTFTYAPK